MQTGKALDELSTLLTKIRGNSQAETDYVENLSQCIYGRSIDELDLSSARVIWQTLRIERAEQEARTSAAIQLNAARATKEFHTYRFTAS